MWILPMYVRSWEMLVPRSWALEEGQVHNTTLHYTTVQVNAMQCQIITVEVDLHAAMSWLLSILSVISF